MNGATAFKNLGAPQELILTILSGEDKGVAYKLLGEKILLGRAPDNDVIINDNKASRNHARIEKRGQVYWLVDLESRVGVLLNNNAIKEMQLKEGDTIKIGDTTLRFGAANQNMSLVNAPPFPAPTTTVPQIPLRAPVPQPAPNKPAGPLFAGINAPAGIPVDPRRTGKNPMIFVVAIGLTAAVVLLYKSPVFKVKKIKIKDESAYEQQIEGSDEFNQKEQQVILEKGKDTQQYAEAQAFYLRGFREFREENYGRAIQDFEAALALYPTHPLAKRYLDRSRLKINEVVTSALERGERDFQQEKYMNAFNEYRTVMILTNDPKNKNFQLAQKRIETIQLILTNNR